ncbi:diphosphomevalonate decarboxylase, partial [Streptomyces sp. SID5475]|nr:diphosphomevalonate decarboxylase [Streptomyces sp. SID5475]
ALIIPMNNSISVTLEKFYTETKVTFNDQLTQDQFWLNGEKVSGKELEKISKYMDIVRNRAGIDWYAEIESDNFVPTAAGLASSASAYAALAAACNQALDMQLSDKD